MTTILLVIFLLWAFAGLVAFIPYVFGVLYLFLNFFIDLIKFNIYPVGDFVPMILIGLIIFGIFRFIFHSTVKHSS